MVVRKEGGRCPTQPALKGEKINIEVSGPDLSCSCFCFPALGCYHFYLSSSSWGQLSADLARLKHGRAAQGTRTHCHSILQASMFWDGCAWQMKCSGHPHLLRSGRELRTSQNLRLLFCLFKIGCFILLYT